MQVLVGILVKAESVPMILRGCRLRKRPPTKHLGSWRSQVAHLHGMQVVAGSNPAGSTPEVGGFDSRPVICERMVHQRR